MPPSTDGTTERLVKSREMLFVAARLSQIVLWVVKEEHEHRPTNEPNIDAPAPWIADQLLMTAAPHEERRRLLTSRVSRRYAPRACRSTAGSRA